MLNNIPDVFVKLIKIEMKYKVNIDKKNLLHFQYIKYTNFNTKFLYLYI
jgi:hypothetical protein